MLQKIYILIKIIKDGFTVGSRGADLLKYIFFVTFTRTIWRLHTTKVGIHSQFSTTSVGIPCWVCRGKGFCICKLCKGNSTIKWSPLFDPVAINPCLCPTCDGNRFVRNSLRNFNAVIECSCCAMFAYKL